jgi:hypothetical protein
MQLSAAVLGVLAGCGPPQDSGADLEDSATASPAVPVCDPFTISRWQEWSDRDLPSRGSPSGTQPGGSLGDLDGDGDATPEPSGLVALC